MKKLFALMMIAAVMVSCNDSSESTEKKDSTSVNTTVTPNVAAEADSISRAAGDSLRRTDSIR